MHTDATTVKCAQYTRIVALRRCPCRRVHIPEHAYYMHTSAQMSHSNDFDVRKSSLEITWTQELLYQSIDRLCLYKNSLHIPHRSNSGHLTIFIHALSARMRCIGHIFARLSQFIEHFACFLQWHTIRDRRVITEQREQKEEPIY